MVAQAQPNVSGFYGDVTLDGNPVADGTVVKAWIGNVEAGSVTTTGSSYQISINGEGQDFSDKPVTFTVGADDAQVAEKGMFVKGAQVALNLTASSIPASGVIGITLSPKKGTATNVIGEGAAYNNPVYIYFDGELYTTIKSDTEGNFNAVVVPTTNVAGDYEISAIDVLEHTASATFTLSIPTSGTGEPGTCDCPPGEAGAAGPAGPAGADGEDGDDAGSTMGIVALIIAIIAIILAIVFRVMKPAGAPEA
jgi:hypothetical protein